MTTDLTIIESRHQQALDRYRAMELERETNILESLASHVELPEATGWGDIIPRSEYPGNDDFARGGRSYFQTRIEDRQDGKYVPVYETEMDLRYQRAVARFVQPNTSVGVGALLYLYNICFGNGFTFKAESDARMEPPQGLAELAQQIIDEFCDLNDFHGTLDKEIHDKSRVDGESSLKLEPHGGNVKATPLEPEQIVEPADKRQLDDWRNSEDGSLPDLPMSWSFGVHSLVRDASNVFGYHVVYDGAGRDWEYLSADEVLHIKRNVPLTAKRGVTDFLPVSRDICANDKLTKMLGISAPAIASIVGVRKFAAGTTSTSASSLIGGKGGDSITAYSARGTSRTATTEPFAGGQLLNVGGFDYVNGPLGARENSALLLVTGLLLRSAGTNWLIPEYVISNDPSNGNFASTSVAAQTSVDARKSDQRFYGRQFVNLHWKVLKLAYKMGRFSQFGLSWEVIERLLSVTYEGPQITADSFTEVVAQVIQQRDSGLLSKRSAATRLGIDYDHEKENIETDGDVPPVPQFTPGPDIQTPNAAVEMKPQPDAASDITPSNIVADKTLNGAQITAAIDVLNGVGNGATAELVGIELLVALGIDELTAKRMVSASLKNAKKQDAKQPTMSAALQGALESVKSDDEARAILERFKESYP